MNNRFPHHLIFQFFLIGALGLSVPRAGASGDPWLVRNPAPVAASVGLSSGPVDTGIPNAFDLPTDLVSGDFNGDGRSDLVVAYFSGDEVVWYFGRPSGGFTQGGRESVGTHPGVANDLPRQLAVADFDGDGFSDLAVVCSGNSNFATGSSLGILYGAPRGGFEPFRALPMAPVIPTLPVYKLVVRAGLIDGDERPDLLVGHFDSGQFSVLLHDQGRRWKEPRIYKLEESGGDGPADLVLADLDFDGNTDLVTVQRQRVRIWAGDGTGAFQPGADNAALDFPGADLTAGEFSDFDRNGQWDLALLDGTGSRLMLLMDLGLDRGPARLWKLALPEGAGPIDLTVYDADLDGLDDVAVIYRLKGGGEVFRGRVAAGEPPLVRAASFATSRNPRALAAFQGNDDPWPDLAVANEGDQTNADNQDVVLNYTPGPAEKGNQLIGRSATIPAHKASPYLDRPRGLAWDAQAGALWTVDRARRRLIRLPGAQQPRLEIALLQVHPGVSPLDPVGLAPGGAGRVWLADRLGGRVCLVDAGGNQLAALSTGGLGIPNPAAMACDPATDRLFVADEREPRLVVMRTDGTLVQKLSLPDDLPARALAWDDLHGRLWLVPDARPGQVILFDLVNSGGPSEPVLALQKFQVIELEDAAPLWARTRVTSLALDPATERFWALSDSGALLQASFAGRAQAVTEWSLLRRISALAVLPDGTRLLGDGGLLATVVRVDDQGEVLSSFTLNDLETSDPVRIADLASGPGRIYVLNAEGEAIVCDEAGQRLETLGHEQLEGRRPHGLHYDRTRHRLLVALTGRLVTLPLTDTGATTDSLESGEAESPWPWPEVALPVNYPPTALTDGPASGTMTLYSASRGALVFFDPAIKLRTVVARTEFFPAGFEPMAAALQPAQRDVYLFGGTGGVTLLEAALERPADAVRTDWLAYR